MAIQIGRSPSELAGEMRSAIESVIPGATVEVLPNGAGHFSVRVVAAAFAGKNRVQQQQLVYRALTPFMSGEGAPVHAIDELRTETA
jgi:stress-induced morphogen